MGRWVVTRVDQLTQRVLEQCLGFRKISDQLTQVWPASRSGEVKVGEKKKGKIDRRTTRGIEGRPVDLGEIVGQVTRARAMKF